MEIHTFRSIVACGLTAEGKLELAKDMARLLDAAIGKTPSVEHILGGLEIQSQKQDSLLLLAVEENRAVGMLCIDFPTHILSMTLLSALAAQVGPGSESIEQALISYAEDIARDHKRKSVLALHGDGYTVWSCDAYIRAGYTVSEASYVASKHL